jgi:hypothetical protein
MNYAEAAYFDGAHVAHIAAWKEHERLCRLHGIPYRVCRDGVPLRPPRAFTRY